VVAESSSDAKAQPTLSPEEIARKAEDANEEFNAAVAREARTIRISVEAYEAHVAQLELGELVFSFITVLCVGASLVYQAYIVARVLNATCAQLAKKLKPELRRTISCCTIFSKQGGHQLPLQSQRILPSCLHKALLR